MTDNDDADDFTWEAFDDADDSADTVEDGSDSAAAARIKALRQNVADREETIADLREELAASEDRADDLEAVVEAKEAELSQLEAQLDDHRETIAHLRTVVDDHADTIDRVEQALDDLAAEKIDLDQSVAALRADIEAETAPTAFGSTFTDHVRAVMFTLTGISIALFVLIALIYTGTITPLLVNAPSIQSTGGSGGGESLPFDEAAVEAAIHDELNERRRAAGVAPLATNRTLHAIADNYSQTMAAQGFFSHTTPGGETFSDRLAHAGYNCTVHINGTATVHGAENLATAYYNQPFNTSDGVVHYKTPSQLADGVVDDWMASETQRSTLLAPHWATEGIGVNMTREQKVYVTQTLC